MLVYVPAAKGIFRIVGVDRIFGIDLFVVIFGFNRTWIQYLGATADVTEGWETFSAKS